MKNKYPQYTIDKSSLPDWAIKGRTQFQNQHSGPAETAKGVLTQFTTVGFSFEDLMHADGIFCGNLTPEIIWDWTNKLSDSYLDYMAELGKTIIQVPWSVGFSTQSEDIQRQYFIDFTKRARQRNLKVCAYLSLRNIFWKDAFAHEPFLKEVVAIYPDGSPFLYGYSQARYMACLNHQSWIDYLNEKVKMAIEQADVDAIYFDNLGTRCSCPVCKALFAEFTENLIGEKLEIPYVKQLFPRKIKEKEEVEVRAAEKEQRECTESSDEYCRNYLFKRFQSLMVTEALKKIRDFAFKLKSPLGFSANNHLEPFINDVCNIVYSQDTRLPGVEWSNIPILRYLEADCDSWKQQITNHPLPEGHDPRLSMAEAMAFQGYPYQITDKNYNRFYHDHPELFSDLENVAKVAVISESPKRKPYYLQDLGLQNILYDVILPDKWQQTNLEKYDVILVSDLEAIDEQLFQKLEELDWEQRKVIMTGTSACYNAFGQKTDRKTTNFDEKIVLETRISQKIIQTIKKSHISPVEIDAPEGVACNLLRKKGSQTYFLHLINYNEKPLGPIKIRFQLPGLELQQVKLFSPDSENQPHELNITKKHEIELKEIDIYAIVLSEGSG